MTSGSASGSVRKKRIIVGGVLLALVLIGAIVATVVVLTRPKFEEVEAQEFQGTSMIKRMNKTVLVNETREVETMVGNETVLVNITEVVEQTITVTEVIEDDGNYIWYKPSNWDFPLNGHDVVAYFSLDEGDYDGIVMGSDQYTTTIYAQTWRFSSAENKALFDANPAKYVPKYGGHCALAMASGSVVSGDPRAWTIYEDDLYINVGTFVISGWKRDIVNKVRNADREWSEIPQDNPH